MKFSRSSLLLCFGMVGTVCGQWDYEKCREDEVGCLKNADDFSPCLDQCTTELPLCLTGFLNAREVATCCSPTWRATQFLQCSTFAQKQDFCIENCLPSCINELQLDFFLCIAGNSGNGRCIMENCLTGIVLDRDIIDTGDDNDFIEEIGEELSDNVGNLGDCDDTNELAREVCEVNNICCAECDRKLGELINCVVNSLVRPFIVESDGNDYFDPTEDRCETIAEKDGQDACENLMERRVLVDNTTAKDDMVMTEMEEDTTNPEVAEVSEECMNKFKSLMVLGNVTGAGAELLKCSTVGGVKIISANSTEAPTEAPKESAANTFSRSFISAVFLVVAAVFA